MAAEPGRYEGYGLRPRQPGNARFPLPGAMAQASNQRIMAADQQGRPNIGGVMFLPYLRIVPMHLALIIGLSAGYAGGMLLFATLKTLADALMHWIEYRITVRTVESPA